MCFSPQRRAMLRRVKSKKCFGPDVFCTFSLENVLFATASCIFWTSELTKVLRTRHVLYILTSECAFRHSGVQFLLSSRTTWLRTRRFNRPTFRLTWHTNHWKNTAFRDFSNISRAWIFFRLTFWLLHLLSTDLTLYCWALHLLFNCPYCRKFLFKLPSIIWLYVYIQAEGTPIFRPWHAPWILPQRSQKMQNSFLSLCHSTDKKWVLTNLINYMIWVTFVYDMRQVPLPFAHVAVLHPATISSFSHQEKSRSRRSKGTRRQRIFPDIWAVSRGGETPGVLAIKHVVEYITWLSRGGSKHV